MFVEEVFIFVGDVCVMLLKVEERFAVSVDGASLDVNERAFVEFLFLYCV